MLIFSKQLLPYQTFAIYLLFMTFPTPSWHHSLFQHFFALLLFCPRMQNFMCSDNSETMKKTKAKRTKGACFSPVFVVAKSNCISSMLQKDNA